MRTMMMKMEMPPSEARSASSDPDSWMILLLSTKRKTTRKKRWVQRPFVILQCLLLFQ